MSIAVKYHGKDQSVNNLKSMATLCFLSQAYLDRVSEPVRSFISRCILLLAPVKKLRLRRFSLVICRPFGKTRTGDRGECGRIAEIYSHVLNVKLNRNGALCEVLPMFYISV